MSYNNNMYGAASNDMYHQQPLQPQLGSRSHSLYQPQQQQQQSALRNNSSQLWMGELDPFWDENYIKSIWNTFGFPNVNVKIIKDVKNVPAQTYNAGYCFVEFPTLDIASNALSKNGSRIPNTNKILKLNWASGGSGVSTAPRSGNGAMGNEISIFVGDLAPDVTESILFEFFGTKYSSVSATKIMVDQQTGQSKGYGFVRFLNEADQQRALSEMQGAVINGRPIRVSTAVPKNRPTSFNQRSQQPFPQQHSSAGFASTNNLTNNNGAQGYLPSAQTQQILTSLDSQYQPPLNQFTDPNNTTVFIGGLSSIVTEEDLRLYFQPFGDITYVKIPMGKGCGFVQYTTRASAELAISKMQGYPIGNSRIRLSWGRSNANPKQQYRPQQELPTMYSYEQQGQVPGVPTHGSIIGLTGEYGVQNLQQQYGQIQHPAQQQQQHGLQQETIQTEQSEGSTDQSRLNQLYLAARDGRLDAIDSAANGYIFA